MQHTDTTERTETETKSAVITDDCTDEKAGFGKSQPVIEDLCSNEEKVSLDWNANKSTEISTSTDCPADVDAVRDTERVGEEQDSRVCFSTDDESTSSEVMETHDVLSDSAAVAVVITAPSSCSSVPPMNDSLSDDAPPPLPTSLPPSVSEFPPLDTSQDLSVVVEDGPQSTAEVFCPLSPYATPYPDTSPTEMDSSSAPATEQAHNEDLGQEDSIDKYSALSEEDRLLIERILATTQERQTLAVEETVVAGPVLAENSADDGSEEKYSDLSESQRKLIENTMASLKDRHNDSEPELPVPDDNEGDMNAYSDDFGKENVSSTETRIHELPQDDDQQPDRGISENIDSVSVGVADENVSLTQMKIHESSTDQEQEPHRDVSEEVEDASGETAVAAEVKTCELTVTADQNCTVTSPPDDLKTSDSTVGSVENYEEQIVLVASEIKDTTAAVSEEQDSAKHLIGTVSFPADDVNTAEDHKSRPHHEHYSEPDEVVQAHVNVDAVPEEQEQSAVTDASSKSTGGVIHAGSGDVPSDAQSCDADTDTDALAKSRRTLLSDEAVSEIMRDYYTADAEPQVEEQKPEKPKPKPVKPLIAQALLPKASRRPVGTLSSASSTAVETTAATSSQTSSNSMKLGYCQVEIPRAVTVSEKSEARAAEDGQRLKSVSGQDSDDVTRDDVVASRGSGQEPNIGAEKSTNSDEKRTDGREVPTVAESRAFFKSREAALKNSSDKSFVVLPHPTAEASSTAAVNLTHAISSKTEDGETQSVKAALPQRISADSHRTQSLPSTWTESSRATVQAVVTSSSHAEVGTSRKSEPLETIAATSSGELVVTSSSQQITSTTTSDTISTITRSLPVTTNSWTTASIQTSLEVHREPPKLTDAGPTGTRIGTDSGMASTGRVPLTTRWTPKPFSLTTTTTKSTPRFMTFEPMLPTGKIPETAQSDVPTDKPPVAKVDSDPSFNDCRKTDTETASTEQKPKQNPSLSTTTTAGAGGSVEGSSTTDEDESTSKSSDVQVDAVGSADVADINVICQTAEPQSPRDKHPPLSAAAMATELKKIGLRSPTRSGPIHVHAHNLSGLGRSYSMSQADVPPKSDHAVLSNGCKSTNRGPPTLAKSWTQFDYRKTGGGQHGGTFSSEADEGVEHIDVASSKAFFQAAEQAQKQALNQPSAKVIGRKSDPTSGDRVIVSAKDDEERSDVSSSSDSSSFTQSAPAAGKL